ncbi:DEAD/DEAH box helicase family protein [Bermanella marisrubri]|uniref:ATP-dependent helicase HepA n=1 Tax=Bermanella marisrubri TaxID=207949 RepID=Q1MY01_9GAMM|nr:SNF2-related protein [Bermanella marisrubri]EAT10828.1 ATP-dependent helicase HepA [Oceanobacter sp. RED65] [Bermanella marisrubri]QIZ84210.1 DEAD/DEAH box helicase family protein [Bermanella marisrubri]
MPQYIEGQRYVSLAEPELGLGVVTGYENRQITIEFPLSETTRLYSANTTPLLRCRFEPGDTVKTRTGEFICVSSSEEVDGLIEYHYDGNHSISEIMIADDQGKVSPLDRLKSGQLGSYKWQNLYQKLDRSMIEHQGRGSYGFVGPKINLVPHQFDVAQQVLSMPLPRALLADEVGLGKTIEAGLVIHQLMVSGRAQRILICVPASLVNQWLVEMRRKFNLNCTLIDDEFCQNQEGSNPFNQVQVALCNFDWLTHSQYMEQALSTQWDMMVIDESHRLQWQSEAYRSALALSKVSSGALLLTATPEQLGVESHFARLHLLDPLRFPDLEQFLNEEKQYALVSELVDRIEMEGLAACLADIEALDDQRLSELANDYVENGKDEQQFVDWMSDRYGTGRMVYRNTRRSIAGFPQRHIEFHHLKDQSHEEWLKEWLESLGDEKVLIICKQAEQARDLSEFINTHTLIESGAFHEGYSLIERDQIAAQFVEPDGLQILVSSEIGGEGRNFQHAKYLVLYDLPSHPDLVDQRIGRLDRIGQGSDIYVHIPLQSRSEQSRLAALYHHGLDLFNQPNPAAAPIYEAYSYEIEDMLETGENAEAVIMQCQQACFQLLDEIEQGRDKLLEQHSFSKDRVSPLLDSIKELDEEQDTLRHALFDIFDHSHIDIETAGAGNFVVRPGENCPFSFMNDIQEEAATITFDRNKAALREDLEFISWDHPWMRGMLDDLEAAGNAYTACALFEDDKLANGTAVVECYFDFKANGPGRLELNRYLAPQSRRYFITEDLKNATSHLSEEDMTERFKPISKEMAREAIELKWGSIQNAAMLAEKLAIHTTQNSIGEAVEKLLDQSKSELARYKSLEMMPGAYQAEIDALTTRTKEAIGLLQNAKPQLKSITVWINYRD